MVVGIEAGRSIEKREARSDGVPRRTGRHVEGGDSVPTALEASAVATARDLGVVGQIPVVPSPGILDRHRLLCLNEIPTVIRVPPSAATAKDVSRVAGSDVAAKAVGVRARSGRRV